MAYTTVDKVAAQAALLGKGALLAKIDIESAYRLIPVHPQDRVLQAMKWQGSIYVDPMLPFGLRLAPKIFNAVADTLLWHLRRLDCHYLDDYIILATPKLPTLPDLVGPTGEGVSLATGSHRSAQEGLTDNMPHIPEYPHRHAQGGTPTPSGQAPAAGGPTPSMGEPQIMHPQGTQVAHRSPPSCMQSGAIRTVILTPHD